eukprot:3304443-Prymnesium_polylepis.1
MQSRVLEWRVSDVVHSTGPCAEVKQEAKVTAALPTRFADAQHQCSLLRPLLVEDFRASLEVRWVKSSHQSGG